MDLGCCGDESGADCAEFVNRGELHKVSRLQLSLDMCGEAWVGGRRVPLGILQTVSVEVV